MAQFTATETIPGGDSEVSVTTKSKPASLKFGTTSQIVWTLRNVGGADLTFPNIELAVTGPGKDKVSASLLQTAVTVARGGAADIVLNVTPNEALFDADETTYTISGTSQ